MLLLATVLAWFGSLPATAGSPADFAAAVARGGRESQTLTTTFAAASEDVGKPLSVYLVAIVPSSAGATTFVRNAQGWLRVDTLSAPTLLDTVGSVSPRALPVAENMDMREIAGTRVYLGYGIDGTSAATAFEEMLAAQRFRLIHTVGNGTNDSTVSAPWALSPISAQGLTGYFRTALGAAGSAYLNSSMWVNSDVVAVTTTAAAGAPAAPAAVYSGTTLQETGVDEADLVKSDGVAVFSLDPASDNVYRRDRLRRQRFDAGAADGSLLPADSLLLPFSTDVSGSGLYLDSERQQLVALGQIGSGWDSYATWFYPLYWSVGATEAVLIDTANQMQTRRSLRIGGQLIGSRRVGATLYLVLRSYPRVSGLDPWWSAQNTAANQTIVDQLEATDLLPTIAIDGGPPQALVDPATCLVQQDNAAASADIITIVGIDLAASEHRHAARCFAGAAEAFYMSEQSLYLATTRYRYDSSGAYPLYTAQTSTDLHKFALNGLDIAYRGSGNVVGHLGFDQNRKSFRMGEHQGMLRVITQTDTSFGGWLATVDMVTTATVSAAATRAAAVDSPGRLSILEERDGGLAVVGQLPNAARPEPLGKVGEQLYATRFIGARGYLVTYRLTDPLYVLDLSVPSDPRIAGALEVSGYSDYLFPLAENLLLGVGKDAVEDGGVGDGRFAWYQGVKVALIDVSDPANPREAARAIVGRRGTNATVLRDHHGIALQTLGRQVRIGLPVSLHDTPWLYASGGGLSDYFSFTRTELQRFAIDLDTQALQSLAPLVSDVSGERPIDNDRALLWNDQVHYYQNGSWRSAPW